MSVHDINARHRERHKTLLNTTDMFSVGDRVRVVCVASDFSFFSGDETGYVTEVLEDAGLVSVRFDDAKRFSDGSVQAGFDFKPIDLLWLGDGGDHCPHCGGSI